MVRCIARGTWSIRIPDTWRAWHEPDGVTIVSDRDLGTLQISAVQSSKQVTLDDLRELAADQSGGREACADCLGDFDGVTVDAVVEAVCWRHWYLRNGKQVLFVTYSCALQHLGAEDAEMRSVLATLAAASGSD